MIYLASTHEDHMDTQTLARIRAQRIDIERNIAITSANLELIERNHDSIMRTLGRTEATIEALIDEIRRA
jgi:hypothetical protein